MAKSSKKRKRNIAGRVKVSSGVRLVHKNDRTRVAHKDTIGKAPTRIPSNAATFKVKLRKK